MSKSINLLPTLEGMEQVVLPTITANFRRALNFLFECEDFTELFLDKSCGELLPKLNKAIKVCRNDIDKIQTLIHGNFSKSEHLLSQLEEMKVEFEKNPTHIVSIF